MTDTKIESRATPALHMTGFCGQLAIVIGSRAVKAEYRAWLVDLDGTLYRPLPVKLAMGASLLASGRAVLPAIRAFRAAHEKVRSQALEEGASPYQVQLDMAAQDCGWEREKLAQVVREWMIEKPGPWLRRARRRSLIAEIEAFVAQGGRCALVSDYPATLKLQAMGIAALFSTVVCNGEAQGPSRLKPDPQGYLMAANALDVSPAECLVIGDRQDADGEAAKRAGMGFRCVG